MITQSKTVEFVKAVHIPRVVAAVANRAVAAVFLVYLAPVMLAVVILIKMDSRGPAILRRDRCLADGNTVALWEFRTSDGDPDNASDGAASALGVFLRDSRLDRLPRLINMLGGDVSIQSLLR